jgi:hypothetical protein
MKYVIKYSIPNKNVITDIKSSNKDILTGRNNSSLVQTSLDFLKMISLRSFAFIEAIAWNSLNDISETSINLDIIPL